MTVTVPLFVKLPATVTVLIVAFNVAPTLIVKLLTKELAKTEIVLVLIPSPIITLGLVPVGVKIPKLVVPVNKIVPGPLTPLVVVPRFEKVPVTVRI